MAELEVVAERRRALGRDLAARRQAAGLTQEELAPRTLYGRSTVANVEVGRQQVSRDFWARCDIWLGAAGLLVDAFDEFERFRVEAGPEEEGALGGEGNVPEDRPQAESAAVTGILGGTVVGVVAADAGGLMRDLPASQIWPDKLSSVHVDMLREVTDLYRRTQHEIGGYACRAPALAYISWAEGLLHCPRPEPAVQSGLYSALADLHNLVGWLEHDLDADESARWHFTRACLLAARGGDRAAMADSYYRLARLGLEGSDPAEALRFLELGHLVAQDAGITVSSAIMHMNEAWVYAVLGDASRVSASMSKSRQDLERVDPATVAPSARFFIEPADIDGHSGVVLSALARHPGQHRHVGLALEHSARSAATRRPDAARSRTFDLIAIATAHALDRDQVAARTAVDEALDAAEAVGSRRVVNRLNSWRVLAGQHGWKDDVEVVGTRITSLAALG
jgi:transcriptional regulator with XRE-family HTH domain